MLDVIRWIEQKTLASIVKPSQVTLKLTLLGGASALIYWLAFVQPANLVEIYARARPDLYAMYDAGSAVHLSIIFSILVLGLIYWLAWRMVQEVREKTAWAIVLGGSLVFGLVLMYVFPFDAADIFDYIIHGRMTGIYGANPYLSIPKQFPNDPFYPYAAWKYDPSPYGPVWELLAGPASYLAGNGFIANVWGYKLISGLFLLAATGVVAMILRREVPEQALAGVLLLAWNPVVLYETWANGHNDMVMVFWMAAAVWAMTRRRYSLAVLALVASALVKFVPALLVPAALAVALRNLPNGRLRAGYLARTGLAAAGLIALLYAPFGYDPQVLTVARRANLFTSSIPASIYYFLEESLQVENASDLVAASAFVLTAAFTLWQACRSYRAGEEASWTDFTQAGFNILAFYLLVTCLWFQQWYTLWLIGLAPLLLSRQSRSLAVLFGFAALSKQLVAGPLLFWPRPELKQPWLETWFTLGVLGVPWLYALYGMIKNRTRIRAD